MSSAAKSPMFRVRSGLIAKKHLEEMHSAIWEFLALIDWQTDRSGFVRGGKPIKIDEIAQRLGRNRRTVERNLSRLSDYLEIKRTPYGLIVKILNPKKWFRYDKSVASGERYDKNVATDMSQTKKTLNKHTVEQKTLDGSRRNSYPDWFEEFWKAYPSNRGSKKAGLAQAKKVVKSASDIREAIAILNRKAEHIRQMQSAGKWVASLPHVERYFRKGLWEQSLDQEQTELALEPATYGRPVSRAEIEAGNRQIAEWKGTQLDGPAEVRP